MRPHTHHTADDAMMRRKLLAVIHIAKKELWGDDDDAYRELIRRVSGGRTASSADLTMTELSIAVGRIRRLADQCASKADAKRRALLDAVKQRAERTLGPDWRRRLDGMAAYVAGVASIEWVRSVDDLKRILAMMRGIVSQEKEKSDVR